MKSEIFGRWGHRAFGAWVVLGDVLSEALQNCDPNPIFENQTQSLTFRIEL